MQQSLTNAPSLSTICFGLGFASIAASIGTWSAARGNNSPEERAHAERFGIFVGLWAPTFFILADKLANAAHARTVAASGATPVADGEAASPELAAA